MLINGNLKFKRDLRNAASYEEWRKAAEAYDRYKGLDHWRNRDETRQYDYVSVRIRLDGLRSLKARHDIRGLLYTLNEGIHGNIGGMGKAGLYGYAMSGTKRLIMEYIDEVVHTLELIAEDDSGEISFEEKQDFFRRASHCFGRTALMLSASGSLFFFHLGVMRALVEEDLLPAILSGSSGGSIAGSLVCTHTDAELSDLLRPEYFLELFTEEERNRRNPDRGADLVESLNQMVPDLTFQQAFEKTGRSMNISIAPAEKHQTSRLLNATTSPSVLMHSAIRASCAVPGFFPPVTLEMLDSEGNRRSYLPSRAWVDGAVSEDLPAKRLARLYGVNHYVVSQTNPTVIPFVTDGQRKQNSMDIVSEATRRSARVWFNAWSNIVDRRGNMLPSIITTRISLLRSIINQDYVGDINILPKYGFINPFKLLDSPSEKELRRLFEIGERSAWPKLEMTRQQTRISSRLDSILARFENVSLQETRKAG